MGGWWSRRGSWGSGGSDCGDGGSSQAEQGLGGVRQRQAGGAVWIVPAFRASAGVSSGRGVDFPGDVVPVVSKGVRDG